MSFSAAVATRLASPVRRNRPLLAPFGTVAGSHRALSPSLTVRAPRSCASQCCCNTPARLHCYVHPAASCCCSRGTLARPAAAKFLGLVRSPSHSSLAPPLLDDGMDADDGGAGAFGGTGVVEGGNIEVRGPDFVANGLVRALDAAL